MNVGLVARQKGVSNYSTVINYSGERTIFTYNAPKDYVLPENFPQSAWIYLTSMGENFKDSYEKVFSFVKANPNIKLAFNPGSRQLKMGLAALKDILSVTGVLFVNREEAEKLTGLSGSLNKEKELLNLLGEIGVKIPIVTDGNSGSFAYDGVAHDGVKYYRCGVLPLDAYERTGAGDAFGSGTLSALIKGKSLDEALLWGTVNSASVISFVGSQKGLLTEAQIPEWLERAKSSEVKVEEF